MYNILITNVYSWKNKGDGAIVIAMLDNLKKNININNIGISTVDIEDFQKYGNYDYYESIINYIEYGNKYIYIIKILFFIIKILIWGYIKKLFNIDISKLFFSDKIRKKLNSYNKYDFIIACGGGYSGTKGFFSVIPKIYFFLDFFIGYFLSKKIFLFSQSIGPVNNKIHIFLYKYFLKKVELIFLREDFSYNLLKKEGFDNIYKTGDIAFCLKGDHIAYDNNILKIGFTARKWLNTKEQEKYEKEISKFIIYLIDKYKKNIQILFIPQVIYEKIGDNDLNCYKDILNHIPNEYRKFIIINNNDLSPIEIKNLIGGCKYFIGTRMHSNILALSSKVKTIAISYEYKTEGIMKDLGLSNYCIKINDITSKKLELLFNKLITDENYLLILDKNLKEYIKLASEPGVIISKYLNKKLIKNEK